MESLRRALPESAVDGLARQGIAVPQMRLVNSVQHKIGECYRIGKIVLLAPVERAVFQRVERLRRELPDLLAHVLGRLGQKSASAAARIADRLPDPWVY